jgi:hypothetical protein
LRSVSGSLQIVTFEAEDIEGVVLHLVIVLPGVHAVEVGNAVDTEEHRLAIEDERTGSDAQRRPNDQRITVAA